MDADTINLIDKIIHILYDVENHIVGINILKIRLSKNDDFDKEFSINMSFVIAKPMETLEWGVSNGFMTMTLSFKEPVKPSVKIISK